jgi:hypothetical protein
MCINCKSLEFEPDNRQPINLERTDKQSQTIISSLLMGNLEKQVNTGLLDNFNQCFKSIDQQLKGYKNCLVAQKTVDLCKEVEDVTTLH